MKRQCIHCGRVLEKDAIFCAGCGHAVEQKENEIPEQMPEEMQAMPAKPSGEQEPTPKQTAGDQKKPELGKEPEEQLREAGQALKEAGQALKEAGTGFYKKCRTAIEKEQAEQKDEKLFEAFCEEAHEAHKQQKRKKLWKWLDIIGGIVGIWLIFMFATDGFGLSVRMAEMSKFPGLTVGEAFSERFTDRHWSKEEIDDASYYVVFRGDDPNTQTDWKVYFEVEDGSFFVDQITVDGETMTNGFEIDCLLEYIYTGNLDALQANDALDVLLGSVFLASLLS